MSNEQASTPEAKQEVPLDNLGNIDMKALGQIIAEGVAQGIAAGQPPKTVRFGEYLRRVNKGRSQLQCVAFQNDKQIDPGVLTNEEIDLLNEINRSGRYFDRKVEVLYQAAGNDKVVYIRYNNKSTDQRFELRGEFRNFTDCIRQIVEKQAEENEKDEKQRQAIAALTDNPVARPRNHFGKGSKKAATVIEPDAE